MGAAKICPKDDIRFYPISEAHVLERRRIFRFRTIALILRPIPIVYVFSSSVLILLSIITGMHVGVLPVCTSAFSTVCTQSNTYV